MKIAVLVKQTPDTAELPRVSAEEVNRGEVKATMAVNPWDEHAVEEAVQLSDRFGAQTVAISLGTTQATDALRHTLAVGIDEALLVDNTGIQVDINLTATLLGEAIKSLDGVDLILTGRQSVDAGTGSVFVAIACKLDLPLITNVTKVIDIADGHVIVERELGDYKETVSAPLPAILSVGKLINDPRYPSFIGIRNANRAEIPVLDAAKLGSLDLDKKTVWTNARRPEGADKKCVFIDGGNAQEQATKLADALLGEKVV